MTPSETSARRAPAWRRSTIWFHISADIARNVFRFAPFVVRSLLKGDAGKESCGSRYSNVSWRDAPASMEQLRIERYLAAAPLATKNILHVGVGSSTIARRFHAECAHIDGLTVMPDEITNADRLGFANYRVYLMDKFSPALSSLPNRYHYIVDNNPSSFAPNRAAFESMIANYVLLLEPGGMFLTDRVGMHYHEKYAFSIGDEDLIAQTHRLPVRFERPTRSVRALVKI